MNCRAFSLSHWAKTKVFGVSAMRQDCTHIALKTLRSGHNSAQNSEHLQAMQRKSAQKQNRVEQSVSRRTAKGSFIMGAHIIELAQFRARRSKAGDAGQGQKGSAAGGDRFHFWTGASGKRYVHTIYDLLECPAVPAGNYVLVRRGPNGQRVVLAIGRVSSTARSLNLAEIRQRGAELGADEVHVHLLAETPKQTKLVEFDLRGGQINCDFDCKASSGLVH